MSKLKTIFGLAVGSTLGIVVWLISIVIMLVFGYFSIKFTLAIGDKIFSKDKQESSQTNSDDIETYFVGSCTEATLKQDSSADSTKVRAYCQCTYDVILSAAGSKENFIHYENSVDESKLIEITKPCQKTYKS